MKLNLETFYSILVLSGSIFTFFCSIAFFFKSKGEKKYYLEGSIFLFQSFWMFLAYYRILTNTSLNNLYIIGTILFSIMIPLFYLFIRAIIDPKFKRDKTHKVLFTIPVIISLLLLSGFRFPKYFYEFLNISPIHESIKYNLLIAGTFSANLYIFLILLYLNFIFIKLFINNNIIKKYIYYLFIFTFLINLIIGFYFINYFFNLNMIKYSYITGTVLFYYLFIIYFIFPEISEGYTPEKEKSDPENIIKKLNTDQIIEKMTQFMEKDKIYCDENLTLRGLSDMMNITTHQLSAIFNSRLKTNYYSYINYFRIDEAKKILENDKDIRVIEVAFNVGFNSQSVFYKFFKSETGLTPTEYRKKFHK